MCSPIPSQNKRWGLTISFIFFPNYCNFWCFCVSQSCSLEYNFHLACSLNMQKTINFLLKSCLRAVLLTNQRWRCEVMPAIMLMAFCPLHCLYFSRVWHNWLTVFDNWYQLLLALEHFQELLLPWVNVFRKQRKLLWGGVLVCFPCVTASFHVPTPFTLLHSCLWMLITCRDLWLSTKEILKCLFSSDSTV